ncbi:amidohydrolase family protein [Hwangdonia sp.]|uniref:amidohydrolase family protein n=1 Tax=Hwangdonia sp. TaxID=1883432 RepID=UPI003AB860FD
MKAHLILILILLSACSSKQEPEFDLIISNVSIIDGTGTEIKSGQNIYTKGKFIHSINSNEIIQTENIIDGSGKYLIPGLFDCHAHTSDYENDFPKFIHFGVTSILCPGGSKTTNEYFAKMRVLGVQDSVPSPRVFHTSQHFTMEGRHPVKTYANSNWINGESVFYLRDTMQIEKLVKQVSKYPIVGIKLTIEEGPAPPFVERIPQEFVNKVSKEAKKNGTEVFAHVSDNIELSMALKADIKNILHYTGIDLDFDRDKKMIDSIYKNNISWVTTMMIDKSFIYALYPEWIEQIEKMNLYDSKEVSMLKDSSSVEQAKEYCALLVNYFGIKEPTFENIITPYIEEIKVLNENGVNMVLGTDTGNTFIFPGYSLHEEMQMIELGGIEPLQIIKMGTHNAAKMLKILDTHGTIEAGKFADFILLDKNPLDSIKNTLSINTVVKNGKTQKRIVE